MAEDSPVIFALALYRPISKATKPILAMSMTETTARTMTVVERPFLPQRPYSLAYIV
ncbi:MAG: hypothetical protein QXR44_01640 [Thermoproteota archaeon]